MFELSIEQSALLSVIVFVATAPFVFGILRTPKSNNERVDERTKVTR